MLKYLYGVLLSFLLLSCSTNDSEEIPTVVGNVDENEQDAILQQFDGRIDLNNLPNYANQVFPKYINEDNTRI